MKAELARQLLAAPPASRIAAEPEKPRPPVPPRPPKLSDDFTADTALLLQRLNRAVEQRRAIGDEFEQLAFICDLETALKRLVADINAVYRGHV